MASPDQPKPSVWDRVLEPWWAKIALGAFMLFISWSSYVDFTKLESGERESLYVGRSTRILYDMGGKWLPVGLTLLVGLGFIAWGAVQRAKVSK